MSKILSLIAAVSLISFALPAFAQSQKVQSQAPSTKAAPTEAPKTDKKMDVDSFFKDAEKQTRKAQEQGNSNCVPKPEDKTPSKPIS